MIRCCGPPGTGRSGVLQKQELRSSVMQAGRPRWPDAKEAAASMKGITMTSEVPFRFFDCDNHYYEALDAFTRHIEPQYRKRAMQWAQIDGRPARRAPGRGNKFIPNPTFDPVAAPGVMDEYFRGRNPKAADVKQLFGELGPIRPEYRDRDARIALMDQQGMEGCILLPTLGVGMEQALAHDLPA